MKKIFTIFIAILIFFMVGCKKSDNSIEEPKITHIYASNTSTEYVFINEKYIPANVVVTAYYDNKESKIVTSEASFTCDTSKVGDSIVTVLYDEFKTSFEVKVIEPSAISLEIDITNVKKNYTTGENLDLSNLKILVYLSNNKTISLSDYIYIIEKDGVKRTRLSSSGVYNVTINASYSSIFVEEKFDIIVTGENLVNSYDRIFIKEDNLKKEYIDCSFSDFDPTIYGFINNSEYDLIPYGDYQVELIYNDKIVEDFTDEGTYDVKITYTGNIKCINPTLTYQVSYKMLKKNWYALNFEYNDIQINGYTKFVNPNEMVDPISLINEVEGYAFVGFDYYDWNNIQNGDTIYMNFVETKNNYCIVSYLNPNYTCFEYMEVIVDTHYVLPETTPEPIDSYTKFSKWSVSKEDVVKKSTIVLPIYESNQAYVKPIITIESEDSVLIDIPNVLKGEYFESYLSLKDIEGNVITSITKLNQRVTGLSSDKTYYIDGFYRGLNNVGNVSVYMENNLFTTRHYVDFNSLKIEESIEFVSGTSVQINLDKLKKSVSSDYELVKVMLSNNNIIVGIYDVEGNDIYINNLNNNTVYVLKAYYESSSSSGRVMNMTLNALEFETYGDTYYRVRLTFNNEVIANYYLLPNESVDLSTIILPTKYSNFIIVGTYESLINVNKDLNCELILVNKNETEVYSVIFYSYDGSILSYQRIAKGESAKAPKPVSTYNAKEGTFIFTHWDTDYNNVTRTLFIKAVYSLIV